MATVTQSFLINEMRGQKLPYWRVSDNTTVIAENDAQENIESAITDLEEALGEIQNPFVDVKICDMPKSAIARGGNRQVFRTYRIKLNSESQKNSVESSPMNSQLLKLLEEKNDLLRKIDRLEEKQKYDALERKVDEMKREDVLTKLFSHPAIINGLGGLLGIKPGAMGIASVDSGEPVNVASVNRQEKIRSAVVRLCAIDSKFDETITMLANLAEASSKEYFEAIQVLQSMQT